MGGGWESGANIAELLYAARGVAANQRANPSCEAPCARRAPCPRARRRPGRCKADHHAHEAARVDEPLRTRTAVTAAAATMVSFFQSGAVFLGGRAVLTTLRFAMRLPS